MGCTLDQGPQGARAGPNAPPPPPPSVITPCPVSIHAWDGVMSVPQSVSYDDVADQLVILPVEEIKQLRMDVLLRANTTVAAAGAHETPITVAGHPSAAALAHLDIAARFEVAAAHLSSCSVGLRLFGLAGAAAAPGLEIRADLAARTLNITAAGMGPASAPLPARKISTPTRDAAANKGAVTKEIFDLRVLLDGAQFEVFAAGGRANIANRFFPEYNSTASSAFVECAGAEVQVRVDGWTMDTCYEVVP